MSTLGPQVGDLGELASLAEEFSRVRLSTGRAAQERRLCAMFDHWLDGHGLTQRGLDEQTLPAFLASRPDWTAGSMRDAVRALCRRHTDEGGPALDLARVNDFIAARANMPRSSQATPLGTMLPLSAGDLAAALTDTGTPIDPTAARLRAALAVARSTGARLELPAPDGTRLARQEVVWTVRADQAVQALDGAQAAGWLLARERAAVGGDYPLARGGAPNRFRTSRDLDRLATAARVAGLDPSVGLDSLVTACDGAGMRRWLGACDPHLPTRMRDRAYVLVGLATGARHASLRELLREDCVELHGGVELGVPVSKQRLRGGHMRRQFLVHDQAGGPTCAPTCPACALGRWLTWLDETSSDLRRVFGVRVRGQETAMTTKSGRDIVRRVWAHSGGDDQARVGTRSLRSGRATELARSGAPWPVISAELGHGHLDTTTVYLTAVGSVDIDLPV